MIFLYKLVLANNLAYVVSNVANKFSGLSATTALSAVLQVCHQRVKFEIKLLYNQAIPPLVLNQN